MALSHVVAQLVLVFALCSAAIAAADPPTVDSLDFDAMSIVAPNRDELDLILTALDGKAPDRTTIERVWWILRSRTRNELVDVVRIANAPDFRKRLHAVYHETLGRPPTTVEVVNWAGTAPLIPDAKFVAARLRRMSTNGDGRLEGVAMDADGKPMEGVVVQSWDNIMTLGWSEGLFASTSKDGSFAVGSYSRQFSSAYVVAEKGDDYGRLFLDSGGPPVEGLKLRLEPMRSISVLVKSPEGAPLPNAKVRLEVFGGAEAGRAYSWNAVGVTDREGKATVRRLLKSDQIQGAFASRRGFAASERIPQTGDGPLELKVRPGAEFRGTVLGSGDRPLAGATITWLPDRDSSPQQVYSTDRNGAFSFTGTPGPGVLMAEHHDFAFAVVKANVQAGKSETFDLRLAEGTYIEGRVELDGVPAAHALIGTPIVTSLPSADLPASSLSNVRPGNATSTDADGAFRLGPLPKGGKFRLYLRPAEAKFIRYIGPFEAGQPATSTSLKSNEGK